MLLQTLALTASTHGAAMSQAETQRIGVYVLAGLTGLLVTGVIACLKELRRDMEDRKLRQAEAKANAARGALSAFARQISARAA